MTTVFFQMVCSSCLQYNPMADPAYAVGWVPMCRVTILLVFPKPMNFFLKKFHWRGVPLAPAKSTIRFLNICMRSFMLIAPCPVRFEPYWLTERLKYEWCTIIQKDRHWSSIPMENIHTRQFWINKGINKLEERWDQTFHKNFYQNRWNIFLVQIASTW